MRRKTAVVGAAILAVSFVAVPGLVANAAAVIPAVGKTVAESPNGSYLVALYADPLVSSIAADDLDGAAAKAQGAALDASHDQVLAESGIEASVKVQDYTNVLNGFSLRVDHAAAEKLAANPKVAYVVPDELRQVTSLPVETSSAVTIEKNSLYQFLGLSGKDEAWQSGVTGEGVLVGVIDTGIWPEHPSFADDGTYKPLTTPLDNSERSSCDFGNTAQNAADAPFTCNNKLVGARNMMDTYRALAGAEPDEFDSARDDNGHGTHTASTAAGDANVRSVVFNRFKGVVSGIAPRAQIIAYKALGNGGGFTSDLVSAIDQAVADGVDVINYSVGGGASTVSLDALAFLFAADAGVFAAVSAGNDGPAAATIGGPADVPWVTAVGANTQKRFYDGYVRLTNGTTYRGASITHGTKGNKQFTFVDAEFAALSGADPEQAKLCVAGTLDPAKVTGKIVLCERGSNGRVAKSLTVFEAGGVGMVLFNASDEDTLFSDNFYVPTVMIDNTPGLELKAWIAKTANPTGRLAAGAQGNSPFASPTMAYFSSRGENPTSGDIIKPDITAPGVQILAGNSPYPDAEDGVAVQFFQAIAGTSMSSPVVAGMYALLKQFHPEWTPAAAKSALMTTANTKVLDSDRVSQATPFEMGSGMARPGKPLAKGSAFNPGLVYDAGINDYLGFLCDEGAEAFVDPATTCAALNTAGIPTEATELNYPSIGDEAVAGSVTVSRTVTSVATETVTYKANVVNPAGYTVEVTPSKLTIAPGTSATFQVTITNDGSGAIGSWSDGAITWSGGGTSVGSSSGHAYGGYNVRSPIAVQGVSIEAPASLVGTGTEGSGSFDVKFGYEGTYTAAAHGLVAPVDTVGEISQDPDQTYPSGDDGVGVDLIPVTITDTAVAQWSLVVPGDDDLDLYLLDSAGEVVAQSTNGGTNESIQLVAPADGDYTMVVHGWSVPSDPLTYTLQNWLVPATPGGGSLTITTGDEPVPAVIGETATVGVGWTGLTAGVTYLGAVSHSSADGVLALTLLTITG